jgi:hypothetical protein
VSFEEQMLEVGDKNQAVIVRNINIAFTTNDIEMTSNDIK